MRCGQYIPIYPGRTLGCSGQTVDKNVAPLPESGCCDQRASPGKGQGEQKCQRVLRKQITSALNKLLKLSSEIFIKQK